VLALLDQISEALNTIVARTHSMKGPNEFTATAEGKERLDGICMLFIALGESLKNLDKVTKGELLARHPQIDWAGVKGLRDIIAHHYFDVDSDTVYWVCKNEAPHLLSVVQEIRESVKNGAG